MRTYYRGPGLGSQGRLPVGGVIAPEMEVWN